MDITGPQEWEEERKQGAEVLAFRGLLHFPGFAFAAAWLSVTPPGWVWGGSWVVPPLGWLRRRRRWA